MEPNYLVCYICKKLINVKNYYDVGKNLEGIELYRHEKCKPYKLSSKDLKTRKHWTKNPQAIIPKNKRKKSRQQKKINSKRNINENIHR